MAALGGKINVNKDIFTDMYADVSFMRITGVCCYITAIITL